MDRTAELDRAGPDRAEPDRAAPAGRKLGPARSLLDRAGLSFAPPLGPAHAAEPDMGLCDIPRSAAPLEALRRVRGAQHCATAAATRLWPLLADGTLGVRFQRDVPLGAIRVAFLCAERRLAVDLSPSLSRQALIGALGFRPLILSPATVVRDPRAAAALVRAALD